MKHFLNGECTQPSLDNGDVGGTLQADRGREFYVENPSPMILVGVHILASGLSAKAIPTLSACLSHPYAPLGGKHQPQRAKSSK